MNTMASSHDHVAVLDIALTLFAFSACCIGSQILSCSIKRLYDFHQHNEKQFMLSGSNDDKSGAMVAGVLGGVCLFSSYVAGMTLKTHCSGQYFNKL